MELTKKLEQSLFYKNNFIEAEELIKQGADVNGSDDYMCFLSRAIFNKNLNALSLLLTHGADVNNNDGHAIRAAISFTHFHQGLSLLINALNDQAKLQEYFQSTTSHIIYKEELEIFLKNGVVLNNDFITDLHESLHNDAADLIYKIKPKIISLEVIYALFSTKKLNDKADELIKINSLETDILKPELDDYSMVHELSDTQDHLLKLTEHPIKFSSKNKITITDAIKSVVYYEQTLDPTDITLAIRGDAYKIDSSVCPIMCNPFVIPAKAGI